MWGLGIVTRSYSWFLKISLLIWHLKGALITIASYLILSSRWCQTVTQMIAIHHYCLMCKNEVIRKCVWDSHFAVQETIPDIKVHGANMGPTWVLSAPDGPHDGPMNLAIRDPYIQQQKRSDSIHWGLWVLFRCFESRRFVAWPGRPYFTWWVICRLL